MLYMMVRLYFPLHKRYRNRFGEIDLIFCKKNTLVFVEVKARKDFSDMTNIVTQNQWNRITKTAEYFVKKNTKFSEYYMRFDLALVKSMCHIKYIKNVTMWF